MIEASNGAQALRVREVTRQEAAARAADWNDLAARIPIASIFTTWHWIDTWWSHFGAAYAPCLLFVERGGELLGILPLAERKLALQRDGSFGRVLFYCGSEEVCPDHLDLIARPEHARDCLLAIADYLGANPRTWDVLDLKGLAEGGNIDRHHALLGIGSRHRLTEIAVAPYVSIQGDFSDYLKNSFSAKGRNDLGRKVRLLEKAGVRYAAIAPPQAVVFLENMFRLHARRAAIKGITSTFAGARVLAFHQELLQRTASLGWQWNRALIEGDHLVAGIYGYSFAGRIAYYQIAMDPDWDRSGPGTSLIYLAVGEAHENALMEFDMLRGDEEYKSRWSTGRRRLFRLRVFNRSPRGRMASAWSELYDRLRAMRKNWIKAAKQRASGQASSPE